MSKIDKKGCFLSKTANIDSKYDSFIHFTIEFNSKDYSISFFFQEYSIQKNILFPENWIQKLIQKFWFGLIQFNKIFIKLENQGIAHHYLVVSHSSNVWKFLSAVSSGRRTNKQWFLTLGRETETPGTGKVSTLEAQLLKEHKYINLKIKSACRLPVTIQSRDNPVNFTRIQIPA